MQTGNQLSGAAGTDGRVDDGRLPPRSTVFDFVRWAMLALWIFVMAIAVTAGSRITPLRDLEFDLNAGDVTSVMITPGMPPGAEGVMTQSVFWRSGLLNHRADVLMTTPGDDSSTSTSDEDMAVRSGHDIAEQIAAKHSAVLIERIPERSSSAEVFGFQVPFWLLGFALAGAAGTLFLLVSGPQPWRATRWAWFWILTTGIGPPLFLILAGPTPPLRSPQERHRKLTGGWAFLLALLLHPLLLR